MSRSKDKTGAKVRRLAEIARDLRAGQNFNITRLTTIKSLAEEPKTANRFVLFLAERAEDKMRQRRRPQGMTKSAWQQALALAPEAIDEMTKYLKRRSKGREATLRKLRREIESLQNEYRQIQWAVVRTIHSPELLIVEESLWCFLSPHACAFWAYRVARDYAERYDPHYPEGLVPASAPLVEDIADFWCREHFGKSLQEQFGG